MLWPVLWALCFGCFAAMGDAAFSAGGGIGDTIIKPFVSVAMLFVAFKLPMAVLRQAQLAGLTPSMGRVGARGVQAGDDGLARGRRGRERAGGGAATSGASTAVEAAAVA